MKNFANLKQLSASQLSQYRNAVPIAFPEIIGKSQVIKDYWTRLETYFPEYQLFLLSKKGEVIGFINTVPFQFNNSLDELPDTGWDWMLAKGISDFETDYSPNYLGGLQVIVKKEYQNLGYSREILNYAKTVYKESKLSKLIIPIRPTKKHVFPEMTMSEYLNLKDKKGVYDPWIRTHLKGGAQIIKTCNCSMSIRGDVMFWESILGKEIVESGEYLLNGALRPIAIDIENNIGEYTEPNIWIKYE